MEIECGYDSFGDSRERFDIRFYIIALLFLLFDIEIAYLFPLALILDINSYMYGLLFITVLTAGYIYEWRYGILNLI
jgi:NADH-quinone oxidoreductase subunit A